MSKQNIFIINYNSVYEILDEIKENLSFKIIKYNNEDDFNDDSNLNIANSIIISKSNHKLLSNKYLTDKNFLNFKILPLPLKKLLEMINIKLIKMKFGHQSKIIIKNYELNLNSKFISRNGSSLKLTEKEVLEQMHGSPELKGLDEYITSFCALRNKSQSREIINEHLKTRK